MCCAMRFEWMLQKKNSVYWEKPCKTVTEQLKNNELNSTSIELQCKCSKHLKHLNRHLTSAIFQGKHVSLVWQMETDLVDFASSSSRIHSTMMSRPISKFVWTRIIVILSCVWFRVFIFRAVAFNLFIQFIVKL